MCVCVCVCVCVSVCECVFVCVHVRTCTHLFVLASLYCSLFYLKSINSLLYFKSVAPCNFHILESLWTQTVVKIGIVGSVIIFPVGIVILTYHLYCEKPTRENGMSLQYPCVITHFFSP